MQSRMRIWLIQDIIPPYRIKLFEHIAKEQGIDFKLILLLKELKRIPQWNFPVEEMAFKVERISGLSFHIGYENRICINPQLLPKMFKQRPDVVICGGFSFATLLTLIHKFICGRPYIIWSEGTFDTEHRHSIFRKYLRRIMIRFASALITAGSLSQKYLKSLLPKFYQKPFFISYNCVDNQFFSSTCERLRNSKEFNNKFRNRFPKKNILYVGQLIERKGIIQLLQVYDKLTSKIFDPVGLILVGQGPLRSYIENEKRNHNWEYIFLEGFIPYQKLPKYYAIADILILLSLYDPNPLVIFEALACGLPIICSERAGNAVDFIIDGKNGYIVDPMNISNIIQKTINLLETPERKKIAAISRQIVQKANYNDAAKTFINACRISLKVYEASKE